jgi:type I restriction-modification system DNA methylase subunit
MNNKNLEEYCKNIKQRYRTGISTEHSYRGDLQNLLENLIKGIIVTNEPTRQKCGAPDYIIQRKEVPIGYIEAKDIGVDLNTIEKSEQLKRYKKSLDNLILTDYLEFRFIKYGKKIKTIKIVDIENNNFNILSENFESFILHINDFCSFKGQTIKSTEKLAKMMAQKARMMEDVIHKAIETECEDNTLKEQLEAFRQILIHDLSERQFADIYAQTITYGLLAARLHDTTLEGFSREEALFLVPKSNPFLRQLFTYVAGPDLDNRVVWIVNDLADIFRATDVKSLLADFGIATQQHDPFIHFYETFLAEYDAKLRRSRGVYYTPEPVVNFIIRAVDDILKTEFDLQQGLADTSKIEMKVEVQGVRKKIKKQVHKVQILDPATGTGTFLAEVVKQIYKKFENQKGIWSNYVETNLYHALTVLKF